MPKDASLEPVEAMAARNPRRVPGESDAYRAARQALLAMEYAQRRMNEEVAEARRALPEGPQVRDYTFTGEAGEVRLSGLFGPHDTLIVYSYMFGPQRKAPCPMCTSLMTASAGRVRSVRKNAAIVFVARSPIERLVAAKRDFGMPDLPVVSDGSGDYTADWVGDRDADMPALNVFTRRDGVLRLFWSAEGGEADPGQDPRGAVEFDPLWAFLDITPRGRRPDWYPSLEELRA
ncbi:DUF899 family protein [Wenxinia marina]|uniref:DUF899 domain-containing protein n=1 Tax=Wenxinia marina DSM 24838 TaxID=1123501 RepID=A0A0D0P7R3_9RHOB|nr:DUF899 family protein [Wenxinia marina]KIQ67616.1 hypothetical protein Wenmar_04043 [Wenxinia marina DSM 24838]GGL68037.1 hypothetical protein GCM10011392_23150 [Wenxinia marina]